MIDNALTQKAARIKLLLMDCDGVLTDGRITLLPDGDEQKTFHVRDGQGIVLLHRAGVSSGIVSGRHSQLVSRRAQELGIKIVEQSVSNKAEILDSILRQTNLSAEETAFVGDDIADISIMRRVGLAIAVADAVYETKKAAHYVTSSNGGFGAIRETAELILKSQQIWNDLLKKYLN